MSLPNSVTGTYHHCSREVSNFPHKVTEVYAMSQTHQKNMMWHHHPHLQSPLMQCDQLHDVRGWHGDIMIHSGPASQCHQTSHITTNTTHCHRNCRISQFTQSHQNTHTQPHTVMATIGFHHSHKVIKNSTNTVTHCHSNSMISPFTQSHQKPHKHSHTLSQ